MLDTILHIHVHIARRIAAGLLLLPAILLIAPLLIAAMLITWFFADDPLLTAVEWAMQPIDFVFYTVGGFRP